MCLLAICLSTLDKCLLNLLPFFFHWVLGLLVLLLSCFSCSYVQNLNDFIRKKNIQVERNARMNDSYRGSGSMNIPFSGAGAPQVGELRNSVLGPHTHQSYQHGRAENTPDDSHPGHAYSPCWELHKVFSPTGFLRSEHFILGAEYGEGVGKMLSLGPEQRLEYITNTKALL